MLDYDLIESRFSFRLPPLYRELQAAGCFDCTKPDKYIEFTDHEWLTLPAIAGHEFCEWQTNTRNFLVPFSQSARRDEWGWRMDWASGDEPPIVFCERGPEGRGFAPNFCGFLYRMLLEEFSGTWLLASPEDDDGKAKVRRAVETICPWLRRDWARRIEELARQPWYTDKNESICVFPQTECERIIERELAFPHMDEVFQQELEGGPLRK